MVIVYLYTNAGENITRRNETAQKEKCPSGRGGGELVVRGFGYLVSPNGGLFIFRRNQQAPTRTKPQSTLRFATHGDPDQLTFENVLLIRSLITGATVTSKAFCPQQTICCLGKVSRRHVYLLPGDVISSIRSSSHARLKLPLGLLLE